VRPNVQREQIEALVCREFGPRIYLYGRKYLHSPEDAEDLVQEVLIIVLEALRDGRIRETDRLASFVLGTCRNVVQNDRRTRSRRKRLREGLPLDLLPTHDPERHGPDRQRLGYCLTKLPPREYKVIFATFYGQQPPQKIARSQETSVGNIRVIRHRALAHLRECMEKGGGAS